VATFSPLAWNWARIASFSRLVYMSAPFPEPPKLSRILSVVPIHPGQLRVLEALEGEDKLTQSELRGKLDIRAASLSELLTKLEDKGLIVRERNEADKRSIDVYLTDLGADCISEAKEHRKKMAEKMLGALSEEEKQQLSNLLCKLIHSWRDEKQGRAHE
ncbi:MAG: MarR family winged helix-turn-helix transcriptional regulator, partial [Coriobacteriales bacterium]|jgi:DNA-binding MarR family transcriptional regulator